MHGTPITRHHAANWPQGPFLCAQCQQPIYGNAHARMGSLDDGGQSLLWCSDACLAGWDAAQVTATEAR